MKQLEINIKDYQYHSEQEVIDAAANFIKERFRRESGAYTGSLEVKNFMMTKLSWQEREVFAVLYLDNQHRLIKFEELFYGTIDAASVYPREIVKAALRHNAAAVILGHNHPSGITLPSQADKQITQRIKNALNLVDIRTLDHIIVGEDAYSLAECGDM